MKKVSTLFTLFAATLFFGCTKSSVDKSNTINPLLGDISYVSKFGHKPDATTDNNLRISTHLAYVENLLRNKDVSHLSTDLQTKRNHLLDLLHSYWTNGIFPKNYDYANQRKPCFIDKDGAICAVGYLIEQTTSRLVADEINNKHKYDELLAMNNPTIDKWVSTSGLTIEECAMIQPTYGPAPAYQSYSLEPGLAISSAFFTGINISLNTMNGIQISKGTTNKTVPIIGLITGAGQVALGVLNFPKEVPGAWGITYINTAQRNLSLINTGLGTTTIILSTMNLITNRKPKNKLTSLSFYSYQTQDNNTGMAFSLVRKF